MCNISYNIKRFKNIPVESISFEYDTYNINQCEARERCFRHSNKRKIVESLMRKLMIHVYRLMFILGLLRFEAADGSVWIGANCREEGAGYQWTDGEPFVYYNWFPGIVILTNA